jgi:DMSO/TMAO reductase YedYZ molybdopterin-dependent catalytic subunit
MNRPLEALGAVGFDGFPSPNFAITRAMNIPRRHFFVMIAGVFVQAPFDRPKRDMLVRSARPEDLEMPLSGFADYITPIERFFVRTHVAVPRVELNQWRLRIGGDLDTPLTLTMDDLRRLPAVELVSVLECAGNGRGFYEPSMPGLQWTDGGVGNGRWRGVRLADLLKRAGARASARPQHIKSPDMPVGKITDIQK